MDDDGGSRRSGRSPPATAGPGAGAPRESEERLAAIFARASVGLSEIGADGRFLHVNDETCRILGRPREEVVRMSVPEVTHPDDVAPSLAALERVARTGETASLDKRYRRPDGTEVWANSAISRLTDGRFLVVTADLTARRAVEEALRTSEEQYRGLVETQVDLIVRIGPDGIFTFANDTTCRVLGRTRERLLASHWSEFVHPDDHPAIVAAIEETRTRPDHRATVEARILTMNGIRWYAWEGYAIFDPSGRFIEKQSLGRDITARKAMEDELRQAKDAAERATLAKSKFLAAASHDLRQPMQSLLLFLDVLTPHVAPRGQDALKHLGRGLDALRDLLDSLLDISRLDAGIVDPAIEDFPLQQVVGQIGAAYAPVAAARGLQLTVRGCEAAVRSDRTLLGRMVRNLVENALRYTEHGGIVIDCRTVGDAVRIEVADTGIGIPPEHLKRIWEEFHQVGNPERDRNRGLGLGLAIVQRLSTLLGHPVTVRSTPGKGSAFRIDVPLGRTASHSAPTTAAETTGQGRFAVLVDDDTIVLLALKATFESWGYEVLVADSAERALPALAARGRRPDVVVADYRLREGRTGVDAILRMREAGGPGIPGILLTGETGGDVQRDAALHGLAIVHKPVTPRQLRLALESLLNRSATPPG